MSGWKTWAAGIGTILTGLGAIGAAVAKDGLDFSAIQAGALTVLAGLGVLGIGHKIEKSG